MTGGKTDRQAARYRLKRIHPMQQRRRQRPNFKPPTPARMKRV
jgi:hypothetical protein